MSAARRGAIAATVLLVGLVALVLSPGATRAVITAPASPMSPGLSVQSVQPVASTTTTATSSCKPTLVKPCIPSSAPVPSAAPPPETTTTTITTLTYAVLPGNVSIPPTATPKPPPTPTPSPVATTDIGASALGSDTAASTSQVVRATTVINPQPGGESSSVLPLTALAFLVLVGGGAIVLVTRLR
jgi:hypothetical protein